MDFSKISTGESGWFPVLACGGVPVSTPGAR